MAEHAVDRMLKGGEEADLDAVAHAIIDAPDGVHRLMTLLHCGRSGTERAAAGVVERLSESAPELVSPYSRRLFRIVAASEDTQLRGALARAVPRMELRRGEAGRFAFVFESWLDDGDIALQRIAMSALVALIPQRPELARRVRENIESRAARGFPAATGHGMALLEGLREF